MGSVDRTVAIVGIALLVATAGGLLYVQEFANLEDITYETSTVALASYEAQEVPAEGLRLQWSEVRQPEDATAYGAKATVTVSFAGQAVSGGDAPVVMALIAPGGEVRKTSEQVLTIAPGSTSASAEFTLDLEWAEVPEPERGNVELVDRNMVWDEDLILTIQVAAPSDAVGAFSSYSFNAGATGVMKVYKQTGEA